MNKGISFYVNFHIKEEHIDSWKKAASKILERMSLEDTFICAYLHRDANDPTHFTLYERWNEPSMDVYKKSTTRKILSRRIREAIARME